MSALEAALRRKEEVKGYYESNGVVAIPEVERIFALFAEDEERHHSAIRALGGGSPVALDSSDTLDRARYLLRRLAVTDLPVHTLDLKLYGDAMEFEAASVRLYGALALEAASCWERELFQKIAEDAETHFTLLEHICELAEPPAP